jgi:hypothetical protein
VAAVVAAQGLLEEIQLQVLPELEAQVLHQPSPDRRSPMAGAEEAVVLME